MLSTNSINPKFISVYSNRLRKAQKLLKDERLRISCGFGLFASVNSDPNNQETCAQEEEEKFDQQIITILAAEVEHCKKQLELIAPPHKKPLVVRIPTSIIIKALDKNQDLNSVLKSYPRRATKRPKRFE